MKKSPSTELIHHPYQPPVGFKGLQEGVYKASTVLFPNVDAMRQYEWKDKSAFTYGLHGTPTTYTLEERLCTLEGGEQCLLLPSGLAAIALVALSLLRSGDEVLIPDNVYGNSKSLAEGELKQWGITHQYYDPMDPQDLATKLSDKTRLVWLEAAGSVSLEFPNLCELLRICKARNVWTALDNTWGSGIAFSAFDLLPGQTPAFGADISVHALTKYPCGSGDVLMGSVITRDAGLHMRLKLTHMRMGFNVGANDAEAILRALPSIYMRYRAHDAAARSLAAWCETRPEFVQVLHPALPKSPGHAHWAEVCAPHAGGAAGLFTVVVAPHCTAAQVDKFCEALAYFKLGWSWGGHLSLVVPYDLNSMRSSWPSHIQPGTLVRFWVGLEAVADLQADLTQALIHLH